MICHVSLFTCYFLPPPSTSYYLLPTYHFLLTTSYFLLPTYHLPLPPQVFLPPTYHLPLATYFLPPTQVFRAKRAIDVGSPPDAELASLLAQAAYPNP